MWMCTVNSDNCTGHATSKGRTTFVDLHFRANELTFSVDNVLQSGTWPIPDNVYILAVPYYPRNTVTMFRLST